MSYISKEVTSPVPIGSNKEPFDVNQHKALFSFDSWHIKQQQRNSSGAMESEHIMNFISISENGWSFVQNIRKRWTVRKQPSFRYMCSSNQSFARYEDRCRSNLRRAIKKCKNSPYSQLGTDVIYQPALLGLILVNIIWLGIACFMSSCTRE